MRIWCTNITPRQSKISCSGEEKEYDFSAIILLKVTILPFSFLLGPSSHKSMQLMLWMNGWASITVSQDLFYKIISSRLQHLLPPCPLFAIDLCTSCLGSRLGCNHPVSRLSGVCIRHHCRLVWWLSWKYVYVLLTHKNTHFINIKLNCKMIRDRLCDTETGTFSLNKHLEPRERWFEQLINPDIWLFFLVV